MTKQIWCTNSLDLNSIEDMWKIVKDFLRHCCRPKNNEDMIQIIQSTYNTISLEQLQTLIRNIPKHASKYFKM